MPEWTCGRCTFINHELLSNCEMCEAPKEAAQVQYFEERPQPARPECLERPADEPSPMEQTTQQPPEKDMQTESSTGPNRSTSLEANCSSSPRDSLSLTEAVAGSPECSQLPLPMTPVVLHSLETQSQLESPNSEPEQIDAAMCLSSPHSETFPEENGWSFLDNEVRIVLLGKTGVGKSTTGNNILGSNSFKSSASGASVTKKCQLGWGSRFERDIQIIDTPGLFDTGMSNEDITREVVKCIGMTSPGPHAFVLVIRLDRFTAEEKATVDHFINIFGKDMLKYLVVLFTRMDDLKYDGTTLEEYLQNVPPDLKKLLDACEQRSIGFDNRASQEDRDQDVQNLLQLIDGMVNNNGGGFYTNEMFEEAERIIAEQEEEHLKISREKMKKEMARLREEVEEEMRRKDEEKMKDLEQMKGKLTELGIGEDDDEWVQLFGSPDGEETMISLTPNSSQGACAQEPSPVSKTETPSNGTTSTKAFVEEKSAAPTFSSLDKSRTSEEKPADDKFSSRDAAPRQSYDGSLNSSRQANEGKMYDTDSYTGPQHTPSNRSFVSNECKPTGGKSKHQREVEALRQRKVKLEADHHRDKERMRADYMSRQSAAYDHYNRKHQESRQRCRQEIHNTNSNIFIRMFGSVARFFKSATTSIGRGFQGLFTSVHGRSTSCNGHAF